MNHPGTWYGIENIDAIDSPALIVYEDRVRENIRLLKSRISSIAQLRPHVKTNKMAEVCQLMMDEGIKKFKCATIAEAEMLAGIQAPDVLLAYQPVGPKLLRLMELTRKFPSTHFSCLVDNEESADYFSKVSVENNIILTVFIDLNVGMNRTGITPGLQALELAKHCLTLPGLKLAGLHVYDGHLRDADLEIRKQKSDACFIEVLKLSEQITALTQQIPVIVAGGSPTFPIHASRNNVECSPGTFIFWDWGYATGLPEQFFNFAALVITRVISIIDHNRLCLDLGHKSVAAEMPLPRVHFLNAPNAKPVAQSEEHLVVEVEDTGLYKIGDVLFGIPMHICPTVALYDKAMIVKNNKVTDAWSVIARNRSITI